MAKNMRWLLTSFDATHHFADAVRLPVASTGSARWWGKLWGLPPVRVALAAARLRVMGEDRFNRDLLLDRVARPARVARAVPGFAR
jgi:hypothetical protein